MEAKEREQRFREELKELLDRHNAQIEVGMVYLNSVYDPDTHDCLKEYTDFEL